MADPARYALIIPALDEVQSIGEVLRSIPQGDFDLVIGSRVLGRAGGVHFLPALRELAQYSSLRPE